MSLEQLRRFAVVRSLFAATDLASAVERLGFVQADPIRAPARAQDLTLRHRVLDYRAGELERRYPKLAVEEEYFVNYGFLPRRHVALLQPRAALRPWDRATKKRAARVLELVAERGEVHPREVDRELALGTVVNYWGGSSNATTHLLDALHYRGLLRVARREAGIRIYAPRVFEPLELSAQERARALLGLALEKYAPLTSRSLGQLTSRLRRFAPQLAKELTTALQEARTRLPRERIGEHEWLWPEGALLDEVPESVRLLAPFDPVVWDRQRFELFWGWAYRFEAYTPVKKRKLGYYALPLLHREHVIGWANVALERGELGVQLGYVSGKPPRERTFKRELEAELERMRGFLRSAED